MSHARSWIVRTMTALALVASAGLAGGYAATGGDYTVASTVTDDASLPSATVNGVRLHVRTFGDPERPTVVVIHGGPGNDSRYLLPLSALSDRYHVVFYDQRGSGLSERVTDDRLTLEALYAELDGVVSRYGGGRPVRLVGHSWGAMLASGYLGRRPERVLQAVLAEPGMLTPDTGRQLMADTNGMRPPMTPEVLGVAATAWLRSLHVRGPDADARADFLSAALVGSRFEGHPMAGYFCRRDLSTARMESWRLGARVAPALFREAQGPNGEWRVDFVNGVERFPRKVLFMAGGCSATVGEARQREHMRSFRDAELVVIPGAGHTLFGERPHESIAAVRRYFEEVEP